MDTRRPYDSAYNDGLGRAALHLRRGEHVTFATIVLVASLSTPTVAADLTMGKPELQKMQADRGNLELYLTYCSNDGRVCEQRQAYSFGDVCNAENARVIGVRGYTITGGVPPTGYHYAGWRCGEAGE